MATVQKFESSVVVDAVGEVTGETFTGKFIFRTRLSHKERMLIDIARRQLLGPQPEGAVPAPRAMQTAQIFANLQYRIVDAPSWWNNANNGTELADDDVVSAVYDAAIGEEAKLVESIKAAALKAKESLKDSLKDSDSDRL